MQLVSRETPRPVPRILPFVRSIRVLVSSIAIALLGLLILTPTASAQDTNPDATQGTAQEPTAPLVRATSSPSASTTSVSTTDAPATGNPVAATAMLPTPESTQTRNIQPFGSLTLGDRFSLEVHTTFGPADFTLPAVEAAYSMIHPPTGYPHDWTDGAGAFGRNYGAVFAGNTTSGLTHFAAAAVLREDPRYYPSTSANPTGRFFHALAFTLVDKSDSGRHTLAISNLAGATAGGFVGMGIYPDGFNDTTHAYQRAAWQMTSFVSHNMVAEFAPEIAHVLHKFHFPDRVADSFLPPDRKSDRQP